MILDINTLLVVTVANIVALALVSPAVMGARIGVAARYARWSLIVHAGSWIAMILSNLYPETLHDRMFSTLAVGGFGLTHWLMFLAFASWLGPRHFAAAIRWLTFLIPLGYFALFDSYAWRVGWSNFLLSLQLVLVTSACFRPRTALRGSWRLVVAFGLGSMAILTFGRGLLGAFTDLYPSFLTPHPWNLAAMMMTNLVPLVVNFAILGGWHEEAESALHDQAITDTLTGLHNRRGWQEVAVPLAANARRNHLPVALLMLDIDYFKQINDTHGHEKGDRALQALGRLIREERRSDDVAARIGGEEFVLLLPGCAIDDAQQIDARMRTRLDDIAGELGFPLNFSCGLALLGPLESIEQLMTRADAALYAAKTAGRGRLVLAAATR